MADSKKNVLNENEKEGIILKVKRELIEDAKTKAGEDMYAYVMREIFKVNGQECEFRVEFSVKSSQNNSDFGGYDMLNIIFMVSDEAYLSITEEYMTNEKTGETVPYTIYEIWNQDDEGVVYSYKVKPFRESDKAKLNVIIQKKQLALANAKNKSTAAEGGKKE